VVPDWCTRTEKNRRRFLKAMTADSIQCSQVWVVTGSCGVLFQSGPVAGGGRCAASPGASPAIMAGRHGSAFQA
jgi:hypothetical protein